MVAISVSRLLSKASRSFGEKPWDSPSKLAVTALLEPAKGFWSTIDWEDDEEGSNEELK